MSQLSGLIKPIETRYPKGATIFLSVNIVLIADAERAKLKI